ncbi:helix-turn-helix transcriptional regulator [Leucobacter luti]|uniref:Regulatory LuxR family protein n=1 Tax=Leucobacter luti TaxID=340320 RepID=A0A4Q7TQC8_9MICO|nr:helix-turn-helix transcriptional regulator [Leucobacter luti]MBL3699909.1 LuxR family transcriptional regulator [Leucobacter luti]RZT62773.1 regulatory LuxR family protein [Leucobacter luti]
MRKVTYQPRPQTVQVLRRYLMAGYDVELLSPRGNGGTRFLRELLTEVREHGQAALLLPDVGEERPLPSALLAAISEQGRAVPNAALTSPVELATHMERIYGGRPLTLLVDGPQALPPLLQAAIAHLRLSSQLQVVLLTDRETSAQDRSPQAVTVQLPTLTLEELGAVLNGACGSPLEASSLSRVYGKSAGLVKLALAISEIGIIEGRLKLADGQFVATQELWSNRLLPMVRGYAPPAEEEADTAALETLAVAGLTSATEAVALVGEVQLERLERLRHVAIEPSGTRHWVTVTPPILGEMFRHAKSPMRLARVSAQIEGVTARKFEARSSQSRDVHVRKVGPLLLQRLAERRGAMLADAQSAWRDTPGAGTALRYVEALVETGAAAQEVLEAISAASRYGPSDEQRAWLSIWEARVHAYQRSDLPHALDVLDRATGLGAYEGLVVAARIRLYADLDALPSDAEQQLRARDDAPVAVQAEMRCELVRVHYTRGRLGLAQREIDAVPVGETGALRGRLRVLEALVALGQGRYRRAVQVTREGFDRAKDELDGQQMRSFFYAIMLLVVVRGQSTSVAMQRELAAALGEVPVFPQLAYLGARVCGIVSANGSVDEIRGLVRELDAVQLPSGTLPGTSRRWADAKLAAMSGDVARAARWCWDDAVEARRRGGYFAAAQSGLCSLEHSFDEAHAGVVAEWLTEIDSEQLAAQFAYLSARENGSVDEMLAVIPRLVRTGQVGRVMQAYWDLGQSAHVRSDPKLAGRIAREREEFGESLENSGLDLLRAVASEAKLTRREEEVARLIAAGLSNRQIQEELVLSIRTVENHVHRLMRKLRVSTRQEVVEAVHGWVSGAVGEVS